MIRVPRLCIGAWFWTSFPFIEARRGSLPKFIDKRIWGRRVAFHNNNKRNVCLIFMEINEKLFLKVFFFFRGVLPVLFSKAFEMKWTSVEKIAQVSVWIGNNIKSCPIKKRSYMYKYSFLSLVFIGIITREYKIRPYEIHVIKDLISLIW